jgi:hypothetical protein
VCLHGRRRHLTQPAEIRKLMLPASASTNVEVDVPERQMNSFVQLLHLAQLFRRERGALVSDEATDNNLSVEPRVGLDGNIRRGPITGNLR